MEEVCSMNRLKELRQEKQLSLRDLAEKLGYSHSALSLAENGKRGLDNEDVEKLCKFFNVSADYLLGVSPLRHPTHELKGTQLALYNGTKDLTDDQLQEILNFVEFVKSKK